MRLGALVLLGLAATAMAFLQSVPMPTVSAHGPTVTVIPFQATGYKYKVVAWGAESGFQQPAYNDASFSTGNAAFGTTFGCAFNTNGSVKTTWPPNTDLLLRKQFTLPPGAHSLRVQGTVDNDATVYINGQLIGSVQSGFCLTSNIDFTAPDSLLIAGTNLLAIRGHDYGGATYLDVQVSVHVDATAPTITASAKKADGSTYIAGTWTNQSVTVAFTCTDSGSGVASVTDPITVSTEGVTSSVSGTCTDNAGNSASASFGPIKIDKTSPALTVSCSPNRLWPPNHKLRDVTAAPNASDSLSGIAATVLTSVTSNEPDDGLGDGDTAGDIAGWSIGTPDTAGQLRAERSGTGTGRVYTLAYTTTDNAGNSTSASCTVTVPRDQRG
ncbi:MAG: hypothetical protein HY691_01695 [Chloroflexi bacterium]|nr:hypothetical protein [Chloroflexota bacterium]